MAAQQLVSAWVSYRQSPQLGRVPISAFASIIVVLAICGTVLNLRLAVVTHDAFLKLLLTALLLPSTSDPAAGWGLNCEILNTATSALELDPFGAAGSAQLLWLNRIDHFLLSARM